MTKKEIIWREILYQARQNKKTKFTQKDLANKFNFSVSTVFNALKVPRQANIIRVTGRFFILEDYAKLLYLWATNRSIKKDIIHQVFSSKNISDLEGLMPPEASFGFYSAFKSQFSASPADYDHLYIYIQPLSINQILERLSNLEKNGKSLNPNIFILKKDSWFDNYGLKYSILEQTFADIWNAPEWYAKDFLKSLQEKLNF